MTNTLAVQFDLESSIWLRAALPDQILEQLDAMIDTGTVGTRFLPAHLPKKLFTSGPLKAALDALIGPARPVRVITFSKTENRNWAVPWHQDRVIAVASRVDLDGYSGWSRKAGHWHCVPPLDLLQRMVFVRLHLDDNDADDGVMEIAAGSHREGIVDTTTAEAIADTYPIEPALARRGDVQILKMLTLHRSRPSASLRPRRTIRIDMAIDDLPEPLKWL